jgi:hypothetical protein
VLSKGTKRIRVIKRRLCIDIASSFFANAELAKANATPTWRPDVERRDLLPESLAYLELLAFEVDSMHQKSLAEITL